MTRPQSHFPAHPTTPATTPPPAPSEPDPPPLAPVTPKNPPPPAPAEPATPHEKSKGVTCENKDCRADATFRYRWPWGDEGLVCDLHAVTTQQLALQLGREPALASLTPPTEAPALHSPELAYAQQLLLEQNAKLDEVTRHRDQLIDENMRLVSEMNRAKREAARARE